MGALETSVPFLLTAQEWRRVGGESRHELVAGLLVVVPPESPRNASASMLLVRAIYRADDSDTRFKVLGPVEIDTTAPGDEYPTYRITDLTICRPDTPMDGKTVPIDDVLVAIEVVSDSSARADNLHKSVEYALVGIGTYLIVDVRPGHERLRLLRLDGESYATEADGEEIVLSIGDVQVPLSITDLTR